VSASTPPPANTKPLFFNLANIQLIDGASDFSDLSLIMPFYAQIKRLNGGASGISSEQKSTIKAALAGNAYDLAPVTIQADMNPHSNNYAITLKFDGMPMPLMSPYMVQFAGYKVENGKLFLELNYQIADKKLTASNKILIDQFELGDKVDNPKAVSLPLELAVALLKDANGKINLNVPITGSLDDPHFDIAQVLTNAVVNTMGQLITSPFRLLASLVDSDADISNIGFNAGNYKLEPAELSKLDSLAKALKARPKLHLTIKGVSFQNQDWPIIQHDALYDQLKIIHAAEIKQQEKREIRPEYVQISDLDYQRLLTQLFTEKFPLLAKQTLALKDSSDIKSVQKYYATAEQKLAEILSPEQERLKNLAVNRAQSIANYLVKQGGIDNARVFILDTKIQPNSNAELFSILALK
jgi:outer membrane protein OmpA-like peptidoglycan-associated protein